MRLTIRWYNIKLEAKLVGTIPVIGAEITGNICTHACIYTCIRLLTYIKLSCAMNMYLFISFKNLQSISFTIGHL